MESLLLLCSGAFLLTNVVTMLTYASLKKSIKFLHDDIAKIIDQKKLELDELDHRKNLLTRLSEVQNAKFSKLNRR